MQLLRNTTAAGLHLHELFFLELWNEMSHEQSLDSYRVRCLNAHTVLREIGEELSIGRISVEELKALCAEAKEVFEADPSLASVYPHHTSIINQLLADASTQLKKDEDGKRKDWRSELDFAVADFLTAIDRGYLDTLLVELPNVLTTKDHQQIFTVTGVLLSELVDRGWPLETLFSWVRLFYQKKVPHHATFNGNLKFLISQLGWKPQTFRVVLKFVGSAQLAGFGDFGGFKFRPDAGFTPRNANETNFAVQAPQVAFGEAEVNAFDFYSAAIAAREKFEACLDLLRFNFEPARIKVDERCYVERGDHKIKLPVVRHLVPNPDQRLTSAAFREFSERLDQTLARVSLDSETGERLRAAIRHYRLGSDAESYRDKFLHWWSGLEYLMRISSGRDAKHLGPEVVENATDILLQRYLFRLTVDLLDTVRQSGIAWTTDLASESGCGDLKSLEAAQLLKVFQSTNHSTQLATSFPNHPLAVFRINRLAVIMQNPVKCAEALERHVNHLKWQLARLYRIRCCIVHGSALRFRLPLFAANLEFYLKESVITVLRAVSLNQHIDSLREVYERAGVSRKRTLQELRDKNASSDDVRRAVFNALVIQES